MIKNEQIMVSVLMPAFNHEKYIEKAINSVLNQKTEYQFELIIHDDASPDGTQEIIKKYETKYPKIIRGILQKENQYSKGVHIEPEYMFPLVRGKYLALCEDDDYWVDCEKIQKQVDFLESHPNISMVASRNYTVDKNDNVISVSHSNEQLDRFFNKDDAIRLGARLAHPSTVMRRTKDVINEKYLLGDKQCCSLGTHLFDVYYFCSIGDIYVFSDIMTAWRCVIEKNATNFTSAERNFPISSSLKQIEKLNSFKEFFGKEYPIEKQLTAQSFSTIRNIIKFSEAETSKFQAINQLYRLIGFSGMMKLVPFSCSKLFNKMKKNKG